MQKILLQICELVYKLYQKVLIRYSVKTEKQVIWE